MKFIDLFAGLGGFHVALSSLGHECVYASEIDDELREIYTSNFPSMRGRVYGDIRRWKDKIPPHDLLCAGFPCQPFSKSGTQSGLMDKTRGTLFHEILDVLRARRPKYVLLENVGNFERHDGGKTWNIVRLSLESMGYTVLGTEHVASGGHGLVSPHHLGYPHTRERFFIVASLGKLIDDPFPPRARSRETSLKDVTQANGELSSMDRRETKLQEHYVRCIDHWNELLRRIPERIELPSFPIWGDEFLAQYPFREKTPFSCTASELHRHLGLNGSTVLPKRELLLCLPSYARSEERRFPTWKIAFIDQNRKWFQDVAKFSTQRWIAELQKFPPSLRKLEWNCKGEERDLWRHVLQFRPSGLRVKRYSTSPALVAMTATQIPILGPKKRFISRVEGLRLQGFNDTHILPFQRTRAFAALGNAVHVEVVKAIVQRVVNPSRINDRAKPLRGNHD